MGMYDIVSDATVYCHGCGKKITEEFQTKDFKYPSLHDYKIGDRVPDDREFEDCIEIHSICGNCNLFVGVHIAINSRMLTDKLV